MSSEGYELFESFAEDDDEEFHGGFSGPQSEDNTIEEVMIDLIPLGKTIQALAAVAHLPNRSNGARQALIIVPRQVLRNWMNETEKVYNPGDHAHAMAVIIVHGQEGYKPADVQSSSLQHLKLEDCVSRRTQKPSFRDSRTHFRRMSES